MASPAPPDVPVIPPPRFFFGVSLSAAIFFALWSWLVLDGKAIDTFDKRCAAFWNDWTQTEHDLTGLMIFLTDMGGIAAMALVAIMGSIWQTAIGRRTLAFAWLAIVIGGALLNMATKDLFDRSRPPSHDPVVHERNASYPSGHSMGSAVGYGLLGYALILPQRHRPRRVAAITLMVGIVLAIGFSRIYLRAHWFSDVVAGWSVGLAWLFFCLGWLEHYRRKN
jgi:membrane-associated phospholipid phosphatase